MRVWSVLMGTVLASALGCGEAGEASPPHGTGQGLRIVCTTTMIADLAGEIAGEHGQVTGIMKPGEDPHTYEVRPRDAQTLADADVVLMNGLHLEATLNHIVEHNARKDAVVARLAEHAAITPLGKQGAERSGAPDPHCWFNVAYFKLYAEGVRDALTKADAAHAADYAARTEAYLRQLDELDAWVREQIAVIPAERRVLITSHDAFAYYGQAYGVQVHAVIGISTEQQPRPQDIARLEQQVRDHGVKALFIETSVSNTLNDLVRKVASATGATIGGTLYSDSLGDADSPAATYLDMVRHNTTTIVQALR